MYSKMDYSELVKSMDYEAKLRSYEERQLWMQLEKSTQKTFLQSFKQQGVRPRTTNDKYRRTNQLSRPAQVRRAINILDPYRKPVNNTGRKAQLAIPDLIKSSGQLLHLLADPTTAPAKKSPATMSRKSRSSKRSDSHASSRSSTRLFKQTRLQTSKQKIDFVAQVHALVFDADVLEHRARAGKRFVSKPERIRPSTTMLRSRPDASHKPTGQALVDEFAIPSDRSGSFLSDSSSRSSQQSRSFNNHAGTTSGLRSDDSKSRFSFQGSGDRSSNAEIDERYRGGSPGDHLAENLREQKDERDSREQYANSELDSQIASDGGESSSAGNQFESDDDEISNSDRDSQDGSHDDIDSSELDSHVGSDDDELGNSNVDSQVGSDGDEVAHSDLDSDLENQSESEEEVANSDDDNQVDSAGDSDLDDRVESDSEVANSEIGSQSNVGNQYQSDDDVPSSGDEIENSVRSPKEQDQGNDISDESSISSDT